MLSRSAVGAWTFLWFKPYARSHRCHSENSFPVALSSWIYSSSPSLDLCPFSGQSSITTTGHSQPFPHHTDIHTISSVQLLSGLFINTQQSLNNRSAWPRFRPQWRQRPTGSGQSRFPSSQLRPPTRTIGNSSKSTSQRASAA